MAMIRRSTLVFLTCLAALGTPIARTKSVSAVELQPPASQMLLAQSSSISQTLVAQVPGELSSELGVSSQGEAVKSLQLRLQQAGYYDGSVDGLYGLDTQQAVIAFQASAGLDQTGSLNDETWQKLQTTPNAAGGGSAGSGGSAAAAANPETAPTASELPATGEGRDTANKPETKAGSAGLGKVFGLSLGLATALGGIGLGLFMANRKKAEGADEGEWGEIESNANLSGQSLPAQSRPFQARPAQVTERAMVEPLSSMTGQQTGQQNGQNAAGNGSMRQGSAIAPMAHSLRTSGQMGGTTPLAPVDIIDGLIGDLRNPDPTRRRKAIWELGQRGNSLAMQPLVDSMTDADSKEKSLVLAALSEIGIRSLKPMSKALAIALQDDNPEVRKNAIRDLTRVYDLVVQISQMLSQATEDEDPEVRQTATWALDQLSRIRSTQNLDVNVRSFSASSGTAAPIDLLSSEASLRRSQQGL
jgi:peptidoglycan hydrolase-like protein with peptidoglycan-binding domain